VEYSARRPLRPPADVRRSLAVRQVFPLLRGSQSRDAAPRRRIALRVRSDVGHQGCVCSCGRTKAGCYSAGHSTGRRRAGTPAGGPRRTHSAPTIGDDTARRGAQGRPREDQARATSGGLAAASVSRRCFDACHKPRDPGETDDHQSERALAGSTSCSGPPQGTCSHQGAGSWSGRCCEICRACAERGQGGRRAEQSTGRSDRRERQADYSQPAERHRQPLDTGSDRLHGSGDARNRRPCVAAAA
jgi:hypothetical protein